VNNVAVFELVASRVKMLSPGLFLSFSLALLTFATVGGHCAVVPIVDDANSTDSNPNGVPFKVASSIYIDRIPLGSYSGDLSRYARKSTDHGLISYNSKSGFDAVTILGLSKEQSDWTLTIQSSVAGQPVQQDLYGKKDVANTKVVDKSDPKNRWILWTLEVKVKGCPKDLDLVLGGMAYLHVEFINSLLTACTLCRFGSGQWLGVANCSGYLVSQ
jgi:hypothetical protein